MYKELREDRFEDRLETERQFTEQLESSLAQQR